MSDSGHRSAIRTPHALLPFRIRSSFGVVDPAGVQFRRFRCTVFRDSPIGRLRSTIPSSSPFCLARVPTTDRLTVSTLAFLLVTDFIRAVRFACHEQRHPGSLCDSDLRGRTFRLTLRFRPGRNLASFSNHLVSSGSNDLGFIFVDRKWFSDSAREQPTSPRGLAAVCFRIEGVR